MSILQSAPLKKKKGNQTRTSFYGMGGVVEAVKSLIYLICFLV